MKVSRTFRCHNLENLYAFNVPVSLLSVLLKALSHKKTRNQMLIDHETQFFGSEAIRERKLRLLYHFIGRNTPSNVAMIMTLILTLSKHFPDNNHRFAQTCLRAL